jgi:hypothetical protein
MNYFKYLLLIAGFLVTLYACNSESKKKEKLKESVDRALEIDDDLKEDLGKAKRVFYSLPSPIETAMLLKRAETVYDPELLNSVENVKKYTTAAKKALNFGVYGADLSYASLFTQTQTSIQYMAASKQLADEMGILALMDEKIVERLETNINNRDSSMAIITETFMNSNAQLKESGRPEAAALIIAGGWIEGLYIATSLTKNSPNNNELIDRIIDQKLSLVTLISLLEEYKENSDIRNTLNLIYDIKAIYDQIQIVTSKVEPVTNADAKMTTLQAKTEIFISQEVFNNLCLKADSIRTIVVEI